MSDLKAALNEYAGRCPECGGRLHGVGHRFVNIEQCADCGRQY